MKKLLIFLVFIFIFSSTLVIVFSSSVLKVKSQSLDHLSLEIYSKISSNPDLPVFVMSEISKEFDKIPHVMKPYFNMVLKNAPRPINGLTVKIFSKSYKIHFHNEKVWILFRKTVLKAISKSQKNMTHSKG